VGQSQGRAGTEPFSGGFLGLDNIGVFDRQQAPADRRIPHQVDGTSWMAMYSLNLMRIALELALHNPVYEDVATKFFEHFLFIAGHDQHRRQQGERRTLSPPVSACGTTTTAFITTS